MVCTTKYLFTRRHERMHELCVRYFQDDDAVEWYFDYIWACQCLDDLVDQDRPLPKGEALDLARLCLHDLWFNPFFAANAGWLLPVMKKVVTDWENATMLEAGAQRDNPLLRNAYELRVSHLDLAVMIVERLHGVDARVEFVCEWMPASRTFESYDSYVNKVCAERRPMKE